jgi:hypothetical protein
MSLPQVAEAGQNMFPLEEAAAALPPMLLDALGSVAAKHSLSVPKQSAVVALQ